MSAGTRIRKMGRAIGGFRLLAIAYALALVGLAPSAKAEMTPFAEFTNNGANDSLNGFRWTSFDNEIAFFDTHAGGAPVTFTFTNMPGLPAELQGPQAAHIRFDTGTTADGQTVFGQVNQPLNQAITIQIIRDTAASVGDNGRTNLLSVTISPSSGMAIVSGQNGSASLNASTPGQTVTFTSDFINVSQLSGGAFGMTLSGITPGLSFGTDGGHSILNSFTAAGVGSFSAQFPAVPEPTSLALMGLGCVVVAGARIRAARRAV